MTRSDVAQTAGRVAIRVRDLIDSTPRWVQTGFEVAKKLAETLPDRNSPRLKGALQMVSSVQAVRDTVWPERGDPAASYALRHGLTKRRSEQFVRLFFSSDSHKSYELGQVRLTDYSYLVTARNVECELAFLQYESSDHPEATFYIGQAHNMDRVVDGIWNEYEGRIHVNITAGDFGRVETQYSRFPEEKMPWYGPAAERMNTMIARHRRYRAAGVARSYMFFGAPGTGKSSAANTLAATVGERLLKLDASSLEFASLRDVSFLLDSLLPHFVIIDDIDKASVGRAIPTILEIMQRFKSAGAQTTLILTANKIVGLDPGLLRPGRIDTWVEFALPDEQERISVMRAYCNQFGADVSPLDLAELVIDSDGLSHDYLREIAIECRNGSFAEARAKIADMRRILAASVAAAPPPAGTPVKPETKNQLL